MRLAMVPVLVKLICTIVVFALGYETNYIRQALIMLPALIAEGWLLAQFLRTILLLERWPILLKEAPSGPVMQALLIRARGIMAATILYTLITYIWYGVQQVFAYFSSFLDTADRNLTAHPEAVPSPIFFLPAIALIYLMVWSFKLLWLYIPAVVSMPMGDFLKKTGGFLTILQTLGVFLVGVIPCLVLAIITWILMTSILGGPTSDASKFVLVTILVLVKTVVNLITTASITHVFRDVLPHHPAAFPEDKKK